MGFVSKPSALLPTLLVDADELAPVAIVVGDPKRARDAATRLTDAREIGANREYVTWAGSFDGHPIVVAAHGVGAAGANICFVELLRGGVTTFIRAGSCGAIQVGMSDGELVLATGAVREDAVGEQLIPLAYPAVPDRGITSDLARVAAGRGVSLREGLVVTEANFYPGSQPPRWQRYTDYGAIAVEMELASLFVIAAMGGAKAAGILAVDGNLVAERNPDMSDYDPHRTVVTDGISAMLDIAVEAAAQSSRSG